MLIEYLEVQCSVETVITCKIIFIAEQMLVLIVRIIFLEVIPVTKAGKTISQRSQKVLAPRKP